MREMGCAFLCYRKLQCSITVKGSFVLLRVLYRYSKCEVSRVFPAATNSVRYHNISERFSPVVEKASKFVRFVRKKKAFKTSDSKKFA